ncbi:MAG: DinB family protein [Chitinophagaceae bacterium]|nr:DinB family protein [Chitinophagaceae bacterium]
MNLSQQTAKHFRDVFTGGNWTSVNLKETLTGIDWQQATTTVHSLNTIAALVYHIHYYVQAVLNVLNGNPLEASDKFSFDVPAIHSQEDWDQLVATTLSDAEQFAALVEQLPESRFKEVFVDEKYGSYHRNMYGIIEHTHYHLGQIVLIKKILQQGQ